MRTLTRTLKRVLSLGDSYTIGEGVLPEERWPAQLAKRLRAAGVAVDDPLIIARTGWTTDELVEGIAAAKPAGPFDLVTLLIGVNNQYRGRPLAEYRAQFRDLLRMSIALAGERVGRVLVLSIPDWSATPFAAAQGEASRGQISEEIDLFNQANRAESQVAGVLYVDITPITRKMSAQPGWLAADGLHPSGKMYAAWVDRMLPVILQGMR
jgi:lysophospholipase L1-like esterase